MSTEMAVASVSGLLMAKTFSDARPQLPFQQDIFLLETHVAGLQYHQARAALKGLKESAPLKLRRETKNEHDALAIGIFTGDGQKLGYVPRHRNPVLARLMDAGKTLIASVKRIDAESRYVVDGIPEIRLDISLRE